MAGLILALDALTGFGGLWGIAIPLFVFVASLGCISPNTTVLAMEPFKAIAGAASALLGSLQFVLAFAASSAVSAIPSGSALPMAGVIAVSGVLSLLALFAMVRRN